MKLTVNQITLVFCLLTWGMVNAVEVSFVGNQPNNAGAIKALTSSWSRPGAPLDSVRSLLNEAGYLDAHVEMDAGKIVVTAGNPIHVNRIKINGDSVFAVSLNGRATASALFEMSERVLNIYRDGGHYFVSLEPTAIRRNDSGVSLDMSLTVGPGVRAGSNEFMGLTRTDSHSLSRFFSVKGGELLTEDLIKKSEREAKAIPFVSFQPPIKVLPKQGYTSAILGYQFRERQPLHFEGGAGYTSGDDSRLIWSLDLALVNLFGGGRTAQIQSSRPEKGRTILDISYSQPLFLVGVGEFKGGLSTRDYRDQFYEFEANAGYSFTPGSSYRTGIGFGWRSVEPALGLPSFSAYNTLFSVSRENLDDELNPKTGSIIEGSISYTYRRYSDDSSVVRPARLIFSETRNKVSISWFAPLAGRLISHLGLNYNGLETDEQLPPLSELIYIGGQGSLRGFRTERFAALRAAYGTVEPRLRFESGYLFLFYDGAWMSNHISDLSGEIIIAEDYRFGYGAGLALIQGNRAIEASVGWNREVNFGEPRLLLRFTSGI